MGLLFLTVIIIKIIISPSYCEKCTPWDKNANNTVPRIIIDDATKLIQKYIPIPIVPTDNDKFDIKSAIKDYNRGLQAEDVHWNIMQLIKENGCPAEEHKVTTSDGYILSIFRIPGNGPVVFVMHGLFDCADSFVTPGEEHALALVLAAAGYDVWLGNARGNVHSRRNTNISSDCKEFREFSWDEIGRIDLPAMIDYVLEKTNQTKLQYIGYSQGTTAFFVMCSEKPEYNKKISIMIALAPVAWTSHNRNPLVHVSALLATSFPSESVLIEDILGYELLPRNDILNTITDVGCGTPETAIISCNIANLIFGLAYDQVNATYLPRVYAHFPVGSSTRQLIHYGQEVVSGKFCRYDYGELENLKRYGRTSPPDYPVENITTRVVLFQAESDNFATGKDIDILISKLPNFNMTDKYKIPAKNFGHLDYIVANDVKTLVHDKVLEYLYKY